MSGSVTIEVKDLITGITSPVTGTSNSANVVNKAMLASAVSLSADGQVGTAAAGYYLGYLVTTALSAAVINVRDATTAGAGTIVDVIPASAAIGAQVNLPYAKYCPTGVYADFAGTGTVTFFYWQP